MRSNPVNSTPGSRFQRSLRIDAHVPARRAGGGAWASGAHSTASAATSVGAHSSLVAIAARGRNRQGMARLFYSLDNGHPLDIAEHLSLETQDASARAP